MFIESYFWSQISECVLIMCLCQTKFWNQLIRIWHRQTAFREIAMGFNIWSVTSFNYVTLNWNVTIVFPVKHEQLFATHKSIQFHLLEDGPCLCLRWTGMFSLLSRAAQMQSATGSVIPGYRRGHWRTVPSCWQCIHSSPHAYFWSFSQLQKNLTKLYSRLNIREINL